MQISFFDGTKPFKITKPIRLIELFAGIGAQAKALERLGVPFEHYRICEFDKYAVQSYNAIHGTDFKPSDITKIHAEDLAVVDTDKWCYVMTYSFPCQDLSVAGKQKGMEKCSGTRSGLLWEVERLLDEMTERPQILLMENVPQVATGENAKHFHLWIKKLESLGYKDYWQNLNAKDYGVPQNRKRCFMVSVLGDFFYSFPKGFPLKERLKDCLETKVDEKYYLKADYTYVGGNLEPRILEPIVVDDYNQRIRADQSTIGSLTTNCGNDAQRNGWKVIEPNSERFFRQAFETLKNENVKDGDTINAYNKSVDNSGLSPTITTRPEGFKTAILPVEKNERVGIRVRKLTPKECFRLMDFDDADIDKAKASGVSDSQLYKQAGNSIVVAVLEHIFKEML